MTPKNELTHRTNNFDFIRIVAALAVLFSHQFALHSLPEPLVLQYQTLGGYAVLVFFSISGYLIAGSWAREPKLGRFIFKRLLRIWPGLASTVLICGLILGPLVTQVPLVDYFSDDVTHRFFGTLLFKVSPFLPGVFPHSPLAYIPNGVLWTIPIEVRCYLYLAAAGVVGVLRWRWLMLSLLVGLAAWYYFVYGEEAVFSRSHTHLFEIEYATFFFSGAALFYFKDMWGDIKGRLIVAASALTLSIVSYLLGHELICAFLLTPTVVVLFGTMCTPVIHRFGRFGDLSYGIYIYAFPVQQTVIWGFPELGFLGHLVLVLPIVLVLAWLSWHLVEKTALAHKNYHIKAQAA